MRDTGVILDSMNMTNVTLRCTSLSETAKGPVEERIRRRLANGTPTTADPRCYDPFSDCWCSDVYGYGPYGSADSTM